MPPQLSAIKRIEIIARSNPEIVSLAQGVPSIPSHQLIRASVIGAINGGKVDRYSTGIGIPELRRAISQHLNIGGMKYHPDTEIVVTAGAIESLSALFLALLSPHDEVLMFTPTYFANYRNIVTMAGGKPVTVPLRENRSWHIDFEKLEKSITKKTTVILICNPNNPTGSVIGKNELVQIGEIAAEHNVLIITDDVYSDISYNGIVYNLCQDPSYKDRVIRIVSFSKIYSLSGWRIAYIHGPEPIIQRILPFHDNLINCAPVVSQYAALAGLKHHDEILEENKNVYAKNREIALKELDTLSDYFSYSVPQGAYYIFPKFKKKTDDVSFCFELLDKAKVALVPGSDFGPGGENHIRICFGKSGEEIQEGMKRLRNYLSDMSFNK